MSLEWIHNERDGYQPSLVGSLNISEFILRIGMTEEYTWNRILSSSANVVHGVSRLAI